MTNKTLQEAKGESKKTAEAVKGLEVLVKALIDALKKYGADVTLWFQRLDGRDSKKMLANAKAIWDEVEAVVKSKMPEVLDAFLVVRQEHQPFWEDLETISSTLLKADIISDDKIAEFTAAAERYQVSAAKLESLDKDEEVNVNLKRHMLRHIVHELKQRKKDLRSLLGDGVRELARDRQRHRAPLRRDHEHDSTRHVRAQSVPGQDEPQGSRRAGGLQKEPKAQVVEEVLGRIVSHGSIVPTGRRPRRT